MFRQSSYIAARISPLGQLRAGGRWDVRVVVCCPFILLQPSDAQQQVGVCCTALLHCLLAVCFANKINTDKYNIHNTHNHTHTYVLPIRIYVYIYFGSTGTRTAQEGGRGRLAATA